MFVCMESGLVQSNRLIEYPSDISDCDSLVFEGRHLLYTRTQTGKAQFVVVLGFYAGQREDFVTKDLIEPVHEASRRSIERRIVSECGSSNIFFI